jgi:hypothetical protein
MQHARDLCNKILVIRACPCAIFITAPIDHEVEQSNDRDRSSIEVD